MSPAARSPLQWDAPTFVVFVFDVTNPESLDSCLDWADRVKTATGSALPKGDPSPCPGSLIQATLPPQPQLESLAAVKGLTNELFPLPAGVLVANKIDLENRRLVDTASGKEQAARLGMEYFETSAVRSQAPIRLALCRCALFRRFCPEPLPHPRLRWAFRVAHRKRALVRTRRSTIWRTASRRTTRTA